MIAADGPGVLGGGGGGILGMLIVEPLIMMVVRLPVETSLRRRLMPGIIVSGRRKEEARDDVNVVSWDGMDADE